MIKLYLLSLVLFVPFIVRKIFIFTKKRYYKLSIKVPQLVFHSSEIFCNHTFCDNCSMDVFNNSNGQSFVNTTAKLKQSFSSVRMYLTIKLRSEKSRNFDFVLLDTHANVCNVQKGVIGNFLIQVMVEELTKYSNYKAECPQQEGFYYAYNFPLNVVSEYFPRSFAKAIANEKPFWEVVCRAKVRISRKKPFVEVIKWKSYGEIKF
jgi:Protein of unknown function (DUF1091)